MMLVERCKEKLSRMRLVIYFYLLPVKNSQYIKSTIRIITKLSPEVEVDFTPKNWHFLVVFQSWPLSLLKLVGD